MLERKGAVNHLVILGAGATCAAFPYGDNNGNSIPAMKGFMKKTGLITEFDEGREEIEDNENLEDLFSLWKSNPEKKHLCSKLEDVIYEYMMDLEAPGLNLYTKLLLALNERDVVATFNWDPFLTDAYRLLASGITHDLPQLLFLHGNVAMGYCLKDKVYGYRGDICQFCGKRFDNMPLLYPVKEKNYDSNPYISNAWKRLGDVIKHSVAITFFGYSAPKSDESAVCMMKEAFGKDQLSGMTEIQLINIADENELRSSFGAFTNKPLRISIVKSFYDSLIALYPRRSADYAYSKNYLCIPGYTIEERDALAFKETDDIFDLVRKVDAIDKNILLSTGQRFLSRASQS